MCTFKIVFTVHDYSLIFFSSAKLSNKPHIKMTDDKNLYFWSIFTLTNKMIQLSGQVEVTYINGSFKRV